MQIVLSNIFTTESGELYLTDTLEQCIERVKNTGVHFKVEEKDTGETWIIAGDYENYNAKYCFIYENNTVKILDLCDNTIEYLEFSDGTRYSYDEYRELMKENIQTIKQCDRDEEKVPQSEALNTCTWKKCDQCKYGASEEYILEDSELGYKLIYDNVYNDSGYKCLCKIK